jgi:hypothetical protein
MLQSLPISYSACKRGRQTYDLREVGRNRSYGQDELGFLGPTTDTGTPLLDQSLYGREARVRFVSGAKTC